MRLLSLFVLSMLGILSEYVKVRNKLFLEQRMGDYTGTGVTAEVRNHRDNEKVSWSDDHIHIKLLLKYFWLR